MAAYQSGTGINRCGIGLEAGLIKSLGDNLSLVCVVSMFDGRKIITNKSTPLLIPNEVAEEVLDNKEFGFEIRKYAKNHLNTKDSFSNTMLKELINREISFRGAIQKCLKLMCNETQKNK
jgi:non-canonical (house-cleaning) NTP pyrophosphatase